MGRPPGKPPGRPPVKASIMRIGHYEILTVGGRVGGAIRPVRKIESDIGFWPEKDSRSGRLERRRPERRRTRTSTARLENPNPNSWGRGVEGIKKYSNISRSFSKNFFSKKIPPKTNQS